MAGPATSSGNSHGEFHRADPAYRRQMQLVLVATIVVGALAIVALRLWLQKLGAGARFGDLVAYEAWLHRLLGGLCLVLATAAAGFALWLRRTALASRAERRWPPSAMRTSADVRIRYLTSADTLVTQLLAASWVLAVLAVALGGWAIWLFLAR